jgi:hypothetical protein
VVVVVVGGAVGGSRSVHCYLTVASPWLAGQGRTRLLLLLLLLLLL